MKLYRATPQDDEALKHFFSNQVVEGLFDYKLERPNSFFDQYRLTSNDYQTFTLKNSDGDIQAMTSMLFKDAYINGQMQTVGYVTDLRVANSRKATLTWTKEFIPQLEKERAERNCQFIFSELEQYENLAYNTLLRRRNRNTRLPRYHLFRTFNVVVIFGQHLMPESPLESIKIEYGRTEDIEPVCKYLSSKSVRRPLRYNIDPDELERRCRTWPNFSIQNFLIARNNQGKIVGCMAPWNNRDVQRIIAHKYKDKSLRGFSTSRLLSPLNVTRPFPKLGEAISLKHITHGAYDNPDIFYSLLSRAYDDCKNKELLIYLNYYGDFATRPPLSFIHTKIPYGLYSVLDHDRKLPSFLHPNPFNPAPDFQLSAF